MSIFDPEQSLNLAAPPSADDAIFSVGGEWMGQRVPALCTQWMAHRTLWVTKRQPIDSLPSSNVSAGVKTS